MSLMEVRGSWRLDSSFDLMCFILQELCYDYGYALDSVVQADGTIRKMPCHCGAAECRKRMF